MYSAADVTVHVPCFNAADTLTHCLQAILRQTSRPARILLVDDGSDKPVTVGHEEVEVVRHDTNQGLGAARNTAAAACATGLLAGIDADVAPEPEWLEKLVD